MLLAYQPQNRLGGVYEEKAKRTLKGERPISKDHASWPVLLVEVNVILSWGWVVSVARTRVESYHRWAVRQRMLYVRRMRN